MSASSDEENDHVLSDDPQHSSAALSIEIDHLGVSFPPVYTHQCFDGETIRGYMPFREKLNEDIWHDSYEQHEYVIKELQIRVKLAPSGRYCTVDTEIRPAVRRLAMPKRQAKRLKVSETNDTEEESGSEDIELGSVDTEDEEDIEEESSFEDDDEEEDDGKEPEEGATRNRRMPEHEILEHVGRALPPVNDKNIDDDYLRKPIGKTLQEYERKGAYFVLTLAEGKEAKVYHDAVQNFALFYIETADSVDVAQTDGGGFWRVMYLFQKHGKTKFSLAGYLTLFHFESPFRKPTPGTVLRVCQALILPPYQRAGHGSEMLHALYDSIHSGAMKNIVEINVEDPALAFVQLRNRVDYERCCMKNKDLVETKFQANNFDSLSEEDAVDLANQLKITVHQLHIVCELSKLKLLFDSSNGSPSEDDLKPFRLMVKRRLNKENREELSLCKSKDDMKESLAKMFDEEYACYQSILKSVHK